VERVSGIKKTRFSSDALVYTVSGMLEKIMGWVKLTQRGEEEL
jgi:hypothetical protein